MTLSKYKERESNIDLKCSSSKNVQVRCRKKENVRVCDVVVCVIKPKEINN